MGYIILANSNKRPSARQMSDEEFEELPTGTELVVRRAGVSYLGIKTQFCGIRFQYLSDMKPKMSDQLYKITEYTEINVRYKRG